jgi:hypothetical protein
MPPCLCPESKKGSRRNLAGRCLIVPPSRIRVANYSNDREEPLPMDTVTFWLVGVENRVETSQNPVMASSKLNLGLRRSLHEKHR